MKLQCTLLILTVVLLNSASSQVVIIGKFAIADSVNFQLLKTQRGDQFIGNVLAWSKDSLIFETETNLKVAFTPNEVRSIEVLSKQKESSINTDIFTLETTDGKVYYGYPKRISPSRIFFLAGNFGNIRLKPSQVKSIEPTSAMGLLLKEPFTNEYALKSFKHKKVVGKILGYNDGILEIDNGKGKVINEPIKHIRSLELYPQYADYHGYGRTLFLLPSGFGMEKGEKEYRNILIGINTFYYGISDHVSIGVGLVSWLPYGDIKFSKDFGEYVHFSVGGFAFGPLAIGAHTSISLGTPDYFLNISYLRNAEVKKIGTDSDFESIGFGASMRVSRRSKLFMEYNIMSSIDTNRFGYDVFDLGYGDSFSWGFNWFSRKYKFETGVMEIGPFTSFTCFPNFCERRYHVPIPFIAFSYNY